MKGSRDYKLYMKYIYHRCFQANAVEAECDEKPISRKIGI